MTSTPIVNPDLPRIPPDEFRQRQDRLREAAADRGLSAVIAWSRGATTQDRYADVFYLSNFYSHYPAVPDAEGRWRAKGYMGLVVPVDGPVTLVTDLSSFRDDLLVVDRVDSSQDVVAVLAEAVKRDVDLGRGPVGVLGTPAMAWPWARYLEAELGSSLAEVDDLGPEMRLIKSPAELSLLRAAGQVGTIGVDAAMEAAVPGATESQVAAAGFAAVLEAGGMVYGISFSTGNYAHTYSQPQPAPFDSRYSLREGDMARVDFYGSVDGYLFDFGRSRVVGRAPDESQQAVISAARDSVKAGLGAIRPGATLGDIADAADRNYQHSEFIQAGHGLAAEFGSWGHSLGLNWEAPYIDSGSDIPIQPGMCLAVEKRTAQPGVGGATYEENLLVTEDGFELISNAPDSYGETV